MKRGELRGKISTKPGLNRYLRVTPGGLLRIDKAKIKTEANLDGKYLLRCSDPHLSADDIALGYKQLLEVERGWRDMKQILDLRPVYHRLEERIRAHVVLCWLALLLIRIVETTTGQTWHHCAATSTGSTPSPSPARPAPSASAPTPPSPRPTSTPGSTSLSPRRSSRSARRAADQAQRRRLVTHVRTPCHPAFPQVNTAIRVLDAHLSCGTQASADRRGLDRLGRPGWQARHLRPKVVSVHDARRVEHSR